MVVRFRACCLFGFPGRFSRVLFWMGYGAWCFSHGGFPQLGCLPDGGFPVCCFGWAMALDGFSQLVVFPHGGFAQLGFGCLPHCGFPHGGFLLGRSAIPRGPLVHLLKNNCKKIVGYMFVSPVFAPAVLGLFPMAAFRAFGDFRGPF